MKSWTDGNFRLCKMQWDEKVIEYQQYQEMYALKSKHRNEIMEFEVSTKEANERRMLLNLLSQTEFEQDTFYGSLTGEM